ncbi:hypothetical protein LIER_25447 [Lithospermum erythrorhizon]|uniref:Uncharacterized protein n=1 Tax=Lithospermum erythrorhizon TaxID=34254 RepID=A0AAV3R4R9_LITER
MPPKTKNSQHGQSSKPKTKNQSKNPSKRRRAPSDSDENYVSNEDVNVCANIEGPSEGGNEANVEVEVEFDPKDDNSPKGRGGETNTKVSPGGWCKASDLEGTIVWERFKEQGITNFLTFSHEVYPDLVRRFYKHAYIASTVCNTQVALVV